MRLEKSKARPEVGGRGGEGLRLATELEAVGVEGWLPRQRHPYTLKHARLSIFVVGWAWVLETPHLATFLRGRGSLGRGRGSSHARLGG